MDKRKRYQIFVSSTFRDLEEERGKVMETILNFNCFPAGMELFPAMDEDIFKYIKRIIDESDYYLLIIGGCYGSVDEKGKSWTEREYDYAVKRGIPVIAFDHKDFTALPANKTDQDDKKRKKLIAFKKRVATGRLIKKWTDSKDLALAIATSLKSVLDLQPRIGWVRADSIPSADSPKEIKSLKEQITKHLDEIERLIEVLKRKEADLKKKEADYRTLFSSYQALDSSYQTLYSSYQAEKQEIENHKERIKVLEAEVKRLKSSQPNSQSQTEMFTANGVSFKMVYIEGGSFMMGADEGDQEAWDREKPAHKVTLSDYWIGETQVTQALWQAVMGNNPSRFEGDLNHPVERVSWYDCQEFIKKLNILIGKKFRLPTEAQWEFAARGGNRSKGYKYAGSDKIADVAWYSENSKEKTHPVGEKSPNELGLYDMSGNVCEWCDDWNGRYHIIEQNNPKGSEYGSSRVYRGGGWGGNARYCRVSYRDSYAPPFANYYLGLRLAL